LIYGFTVYPTCPTWHCLHPSLTTEGNMT